jgi:hypothetical protein
MKMQYILLSALTSVALLAATHAVAAPASDTPPVSKSPTVLPGVKLPVKPTLPPATKPRLTTGCPDPAVALRVAWPGRNADGTYSFHLLATIVNRGGAPFRSNRRQTGISISEGGRTLKSETWPSPALNTVELLPGGGTSSNVVVSRYTLSSEFLADFSARISYDPDILLDSNPENDDCNTSNNVARLTVVDVRRVLEALPR